MSLLRNIVAALLIIIGVVLSLPTLGLLWLSSKVMTKELYEYMEQEVEASKS